MKKLKFITRYMTVIFLLTLALSSGARASLIQQDFFSPNDQLATYDDYSGNLWVKASVTHGLTYGEVLDLLSTSAFDGFHIAYESEIFGLASYYELIDGSNALSRQERYDRAVVFYEAVVAPPPRDGVYRFSADYALVDGWADDGLHDPEHPFRRWEVDINNCVPSCNAFWSDFGSPYDTGFDALGNDSHGVFLVKHVPEPATATLFGFGLISALLMRRKRVTPRKSEKARDTPI